MKYVRIAAITLMASCLLGRLLWLELNKSEPTPPASVVVTFDDLLKSPERYDGKRITIKAFASTDPYALTRLYKRFQDASSITTEEGDYYMTVRQRGITLGRFPSEFPVLADVTGSYVADERKEKILPLVGYMERIEELKLHRITDEDLNAETFEVK